ncbi:MAG: sugar phosphate isomerase/epimerase [Victivallales bacterium]|nr:sugar phosphate isomerase/epimerase [Victivallales bacterium]
MKVGIRSKGYLTRYGFKEGLRRMKLQGYETIDYQEFVDTNNPLFSMNDADFAAEMKAQRAEIESVGIEIIQTHGPWRWPPMDATKEDREERFEKMSRAILGTALLGSHNFVIHPILPWGASQDPEPQKLHDMNLEFMGRLCDVARQHDVIVCFENMPFRNIGLATPQACLAFAEEMNSPFFKICLDTGHCSVLGLSPADCVRQLGTKWLQVLHVHDNNGANDLHWVPYLGTIDWQDFTNALQEIGFNGSVSLETYIPKGFPEELWTVQEESLFKSVLKIAGRL